MLFNVCFSALSLSLSLSLSLNSTRFQTKMDEKPIQIKITNIKHINKT